MPDSMYSDLLLLRDISFFPHLDPNWPSLPSGNDHHLECPHAKLIDDCLSCLFGNQTEHGPGMCDTDCPCTVDTVVSGVRLNTSHLEFPLQDILLHMARWRPQTVRATNYCIVSISAYNTICHNMLKSYIALSKLVVICSCFLYNLCKFVLVSCYIVYFCNRNSCK